MGALIRAGTKALPLQEITIIQVARGGRKDDQGQSNERKPARGTARQDS